MRLPRLLLLSAVSYLVIGAAFGLWPGQTLSWFGVEMTSPLLGMDPDPARRLPFWTLLEFARLFGTTLLGVGAIALFLRPAVAPDAQRPVVTGFFLFNLLTGGMALIAQQAVFSLHGSAGWLLAGAFGCLACGFGYLLFGARGVAPTGVEPEPGQTLGELRESWLREVSEAAAQQERSRLARDLHDSIKQQLFISVMIVDDHRVVGSGVRSYLESFPDLEGVAVAESGEQALKLIDDRLPDVVVMDLLMPGGMDGIEATRQVRSRSPRTQVVALTASTDEARLLAVLRAGAIGYVRKDADPEVLLAAVRGAARGQSVIDPAVAGTVLQDLVGRRVPGSELTERELDVLRRLAEGDTNRQIGEALCISEETVKTHVGNILGKLHLSHRTQAVLYALTRGLVSLDDLDLP